MLENVSLTRDGVIATVTLNRPDRRNSLSDPMLTDLTAAFAALLSRRYQPKPGERVGVLVCGGNTSAVDFSRGTTTRQSDPASQIQSPTATKSN